LTSEIHALTTSIGFLFNIFVAKPTAIPDVPFKITVGTIGKKYSGSIFSPSSILLPSNSKS